MNNQAKKLIFVIYLSLFTTLSIAVLAQDRNELIRVNTNLILVDVLVTDKNGQPVRGLTARQFEVLDNNAKQPIESFSAETAAVSYGIVYDMHPTTYEYTKSVIESLRQFRKELSANDDIFVVAFNERGRQLFDFVPTVEQLERHMADPGARETRSLYDAVYFASNRIESSRNQKKALLIISDSSDHNSLHSFDDIRRKLEHIKTDVYAIAIRDEKEIGYVDLSYESKHAYLLSKDATSLDRAALQELTLKNGGTTFLGGAQSSFQLLNTYMQVAGEIRSRYTLGFYPDSIDDKLHTVRVRLRGVKGSRDFTMTYRMSYQNRSRTPEQ